MFSKKAQKTGGQAATVVGIITLILIAYILFLPPDERAALLDEDGGGTYITDSNNENITILNVSSMRLEYVGQNTYEHNIPNLYLFEKTEGNVLETITPFYVRNGWFDKKVENASFFIDDLSNTKNVAISFEAPKAKGRMIISLNGIQVFDYSVVQLNVGPIELKQELLKEGENVLYFEVSGVGPKFWTTNEYSLEDIQITGDVRDTSKQASLNVFTIANEEYYNLEKSTFQFYPICDQNKVGKLTVSLNKREIFSSVPDCESVNKQDIYSTDINPGKNEITFKTDMGSYRIELIKVKTELKDVKTFLDYFEINGTSYDDMQAGDKDVFLEIEFVDDDEDKEAEINVNGHLTNLDQKGPSYSKKINAWVEEGARNYIEIKPKTLLKIVSVKVNLVDRN